MPIDNNTLSLRQQFISEVNQLIDSYYPLKNSKIFQALQGSVEANDLEMMENSHLPEEIRAMKKLLIKESFLNGIAAELKFISQALKHDTYFWFFPGVKDFKRDMLYLLDKPIYQMNFLFKYDIDELSKREESLQEKCQQLEEKNENLKIKIKNLKLSSAPSVSNQEKVEELEVELGLRKESVKSLGDEKLDLLKKIKNYEQIINDLTAQLGVKSPVPSNPNHVINSPQKVCKM